MEMSLSDGKQVNVEGVVFAEGTSISRIGRKWRFDGKLIIWKQKGGNFEPSSISVFCVCSTKKETNRYYSIFSNSKAVDVAGILRYAKGSWRNDFVIEITSAQLSKDKEIEDLVTKTQSSLSKQKTIDHPTLGKLKQSDDEITGSFKWRSHEVSIVIEFDSEFELAVATTEKVFKSRKSWIKKAEQYAKSQIIAGSLDYKLDEPLEILKKMKLAILNLRGEQGIYYLTFSFSIDSALLPNYFLDVSGDLDTGFDSIELVSLN